MARIEIGDDQVQIDAEAVARAFEISPDSLNRHVREGTITCRVDRGEKESRGELRLFFSSGNCRVNVVADAAGRVLACDVEKLGKPSDPDADRWSREALLDEALKDSFPASDPIAISFESAGGGVYSKKSDS